MLRLHAVHVAYELQEFSPCQFFIEVGLIRDIADELARLVAFFLQIEAADLDGARGREEKSTH